MWNVRPLKRLALAVPTVVLIVLGASASSRAGEEREVPLDQKGRVGVIAAPLARRLGLFVDTRPGFTEARLLQSADGAFTLEVLAREGGQVVRSRTALDGAQVDSLRTLVQSRIAAMAPEAGINQEGRAWMLGGDAALGLGFYGWAVPVAFDMDDGQAIVGSYLVTSGMSYFAPMLITQQSEITYATANLGFYGQTRGIVHGVVLSQALNSSDPDARAAIGTALAVSVAEGVAFNAWAAQSRMSPGRAATLVTGGDVGMGWALGAAHVAGAFDDGEHDGAVALATVAGCAGGLAAGSALASQRDYTYGEAGVMRVGGLVGAALGAAAASQPEDPDGKAVTAAAMVGSAAGLLAGDHFARGAGYTGGQSAMTHLSAAAGGLLGLGLGFLSMAGQESGDRRLSLFSAVGAVGGYALALAETPRAGRPSPAANSARVPARTDGGAQWTWSVVPQRAASGHGARVAPRLVLNARF